MVTEKFYVKFLDQIQGGGVFGENNRIIFLCLLHKKVYEPRHEKTNVLVFDLVRHKPGCTATEDG